MVGWELGSRNFVRRRWWLAGAGVLFVAILTVMLAAFRTEAPEAGRPTGTPPAVKTSEEILADEAAYRNAVGSIFRTWKDANGQDVDYSLLQASLLGLTVPGRYRTLHLDLAVALGMLQDGTAADNRTLRAEGMKKIQAEFLQHPWILAAEQED